MEIRDQLVGENATDQEEIDALLHEIDGTDNFSNIGGNTAVALSMATAWAAAEAFKMPLYRYLGGPFSTDAVPAGQRDRRRRACEGRHGHPGVPGDAR